MASLEEVKRFIKDSIDWLKEEDMGCTTLKLDDRLAICVGWLSGYGDEKRDDAIQSEQEPDFAINAGIKVWTSDDMRTDYEFINMPYYDGGEVVETDITLDSADEKDGYEQVAKWLLDQYEDLKDLNIEEDGRIVEEEVKEESLKEEKVDVEKELLANNFEKGECKQGVNGNDICYYNYKGTGYFPEVVARLQDKVGKLDFVGETDKVVGIKHKEESLKESKNFKDLTIEEMFFEVAGKEFKVFDKNGHFTKEAWKLYDKVAERFGDYDKFDALCGEEGCFEDDDDIQYPANESLKEKKTKKGKLKESWAGEDVIDDIADRAKSMIEEGKDVDEAIFDSIDNGLIYNKDIYALLEHYGSIDAGTIIESFLDDLYSDVYARVADYTSNREEEF